MPEEKKVVTMEDVLAAVGGIADSVKAIGTRVDDIGARVDAMEKEDSEEESEEEKKKKADAEKEKADAEEAKKKADEEEAKKKADAEKEGDKAEEVAADAAKKADTACAKADDALTASGSIAKRIDDIEKRIPIERPEADYRTMSGIQAKADSIYALFGKQAPRFLSGENDRQYRNRLVHELKDYSPSWKPVDVATLADEAFAIAETQIFADAAVAAKNSAGVEEGGLRMVPGTTPSGHKKVEFFGRTSALINRFSGTRRYATRINPNPNRSEVA